MVTETDIDRDREMQNKLVTSIVTRLVVLLFLVTTSLPVIYSYNREFHRTKDRIAVQQSILEGTAPSPYRYRVLVPRLCDTIQRHVFSAKSPGNHFEHADWTYQSIALFLFIAGLYCFLREWHDLQTSMLGVAVCAATLPLALTNHFYQPWSTLEAALYAWGFFALHRRAYWFFFALVLIGAFTKETTIFLLLAMALVWVKLPGESVTRQESQRSIVGILAVCLAWTAVYLGLRLYLGTAEHVVAISENIAKNLRWEYLERSMMLVPGIFGVFWILALTGYRTAPPFLKRLILVAPVYLLAVTLWGVWHEVRLLMPLYAPLLALGLFSLQSLNAPGRSAISPAPQ